MKFALTILISFFFLSTLIFSQENIKSSHQLQKEEVNLLLQRFIDKKNQNILANAVWTFTHDYEDYKEMESVLNILIEYQTAFKQVEKNPDVLEKLGGIKSFKEKFVVLLTNKNQSIRAFATIILGVCGDKSYAPQIAVLLNKNSNEERTFVYDKGRAAMALGLLGAKEYIPKILPMLHSKNLFDRQGAISALAAFDAKEYSQEIVNILLNNDLQYQDDTSPIFFLIQTKTAQNYKKELVQTMQNEYGSETIEAAMYALVRLNAKETAMEIAKLLKLEFRKGDAAKALALLDAQEYTDEIAKLLKDESSLVRCDAALALGVLKANKYAPQVAKLLNDEESYVHSYAAASIFLMQEKDLYRIALPVVEKAFSDNQFLTNSAFHYFVDEQTQQITERLKQNYEQAKELK